MTRGKAFDLSFYILECLIGVACGYQIYVAYPTVGLWCLFSIVLVLAPDRKDAMALATNRITANLIGAAVGLVLFYFPPITLFSISIGIVATLVACSLLNLKAAERSALVAVLITTLHAPGPHFWDVAVERAAGVTIGCLIGVILTFFFHGTMRYARRFFGGPKS